MIRWLIVRAQLVMMLACAALLAFYQPASAQFTQQGGKLTGTDAIGNAGQGRSASLSADGNTAIVGGSLDDNQIGAAWIYTRSGGIWTQQGPKLVGFDTDGNAQQGASVALSADGNTAIVGGPRDNNDTGAAWIYVRSGGQWFQVGSKLVGSGAIGAALQGISVAMSADGNTAVVGGWFDNNLAGAAWIWTRSGTVWTQQGGKLVGSGAVLKASQGTSVAISADGNTAILGGFSDNANTGAAWVFTRAAGVWTQQGGKLIGAGEAGAAALGVAVALSGDGGTAAVGGSNDNGVGAVWVFTRTGAVWSQQGAKLVASDTIGTAEHGGKISLSNDGNTALVAGPGDDNFTGAAWIWTRNGTAWSQQGSKLIGSGSVGLMQQGSGVALSGDSNTAMVGGASADGGLGATWVFTRPVVFVATTTSLATSANPGNVGRPVTLTATIVGNGATGSVKFAFGDGTPDASAPLTNGSASVSHIFAAVGTDSMMATYSGDAIFAGSAGSLTQTVRNTVSHDFNGDGKSDILWRDDGGNVAQWLMNGGAVAGNALIGYVSSSWSLVGQRDFSGDGKNDILWRDSGGNVTVWLMNGAVVTSAATIGNIPINWSVAGTADFNGDGKGDILWRDGGGNVAFWLMNWASISSSVTIGNIPANWNVVGTADFDGNGKADILWRDGGGNVAAWFMDGATLASVAKLGNIPANWIVVGTGDFDGDGKADILWRDGGGNVAVWFMNGATLASVMTLGNIPANWFVAQTGDYNGDSKSDILWRDGGGNVALWLMNGAAIAAVVNVGNIPANWAVQGANAD